MNEQRTLARCGELLLNSDFGVDGTCLDGDRA